jgi:hypothetical protein
MEILVAGCSMLDKEKTFLIPFPLKTGFPLRYNKYPETGIQYLYIICTKRY